MSFDSLYRMSFYAMLIAAAFVLSIDVLDNSSAILYPFGVAAASVVAFLSVDRNPKLGLSSLFADMLAVLVTGLALVEYKTDESQMVLALGHWLVYLTLIYMFRKKSLGGDEVMFRLGLFQVLVGTVIRPSTHNVRIAHTKSTMPVLWLELMTVPTKT